MGETRRGEGPERELTYGEWHESVVPLELPVLIQKVLGVKCIRPCKVLGVSHHGAQQRDHLRSLKTEKEKSDGGDAGQEHGIADSARLH